MSFFFLVLLPSSFASWIASFALSFSALLRAVHHFSKRPPSRNVCVYGARKKVVALHEVPHRELRAHEMSTTRLYLRDGCGASRGIPQRSLTARGADTLALDDGLGDGCKTWRCTCSEGSVTRAYNGVAERFSSYIMF